ncbi:M20/M25/M40 family metallo-hydrolase [Bacteroidota bacterium]
MIKQIFRIVFIACLFSSFVLPQQNSGSLVEINSNDFDLDKIHKKSNLKVICRVGNNLIVLVPQSDLVKIFTNEDEYQIIEKSFEFDNHFLLRIPADINNFQPSNGDVLYSNANYMIVKNYTPSFVDMKNGINISKIKSIDKNNLYTGLVNGFNSSPGLDSLISSVVDDISKDSVQKYIQELQDYNTRFMIARNRFEVSDWIRSKFENWGFNNVEYDSFYAYTRINSYGISIDTVSLQRNVVATIEGTLNKDNNIIICGHYDSFNSHASPMNYAPGADDNASGTAAVLEIARVLMKNQILPEVTLKFIPFAAEELLYFGDAGSEHYAGEAFLNKMNIRLVMNHDMISHTSQTLTNSSVNVHPGYDTEPYSLYALESFNKFTMINGLDGYLISSDLIPFHENGYAGIYFEEDEFSPYYHTSNDRIENYNMDYCTEVIKASCAALIYTDNYPEPVNKFEISDFIGSTLLKLDWTASEDADLDHYQVYIGLDSEHILFEYSTLDTTFLVDNLSADQEYFIGVTVSDNEGLESFITGRYYTPSILTHTDGILVIDETYDGSGNLLSPTDSEVDDFYSDIIDEFKISELDIGELEQLNISDIGTYSTIIWHGNDLRDMFFPFSVLEELKRFLTAGGNLLYTGFMPSKAFLKNNIWPRDFHFRDFAYDYLKINHVEKVLSSRFAGAEPISDVYNSIYVDSSKTPEQSSYHLWDIESISAAPGAVEIYKYETFFDTTSPAGQMRNQPVGIEYLGDDFKVIVLSFPLYYMNADDASDLINYILAEKFGETTSISDNKSLPETFDLFQNYPNPFNPSTTIEFQIPKENNVSLKIYNIIGEEIRTLLNEYKKPGYYRVNWNGYDNKGKEVSTGIYFYKLNAGSFSKSQKMILLR